MINWASLESAVASTGARWTLNPEVGEFFLIQAGVDRLNAIVEQYHYNKIGIVGHWDFPQYWVLKRIV